MNSATVTVPRTLDPVNVSAYLAYLGEHLPEIGAMSTAHALRLGVIASLVVRADDYDAWRERMAAQYAPDVIDAIAVAAVGILEPARPGERLPEPFAALLVAEAAFAAQGYDPDALATFVTSEILAGDEAIQDAQALLESGGDRDW